MRAKNTPHARPLKIDFEINEIDQEIGFLGDAGWHAKAIAHEVGLTVSQVHGRLRLAGVKLKNYRNGKSEMSRFVVGIIMSRHSARDRQVEARQVSENFENLQEGYVKHSSKLRKPKTVGSN